MAATAARVVLAVAVAAAVLGIGMGKGMGATSAFPAAAVHAAYESREGAAARAAGMRLVLPSRTMEPAWISPTQVLDLVKEGEQFADLTETPYLDVGARESPRTLAFPAAPTHQQEVAKFIAAVNISRVEAELTTFSTFFTRYYQVRGRERGSAGARGDC